MYEVRFYRDKYGKSEIVDYLDYLSEKGKTSKTERLNSDKILAYIGAARSKLRDYMERFGG